MPKSIAAEWDAFRKVAVDAIPRVGPPPKTRDEAIERFTKLMRFAFFAGAHAGIGIVAGFSDNDEQAEAHAHTLDAERQQWGRDVMKGIYPS